MASYAERPRTSGAAESSAITSMVEDPNHYTRPIASAPPLPPPASVRKGHFYFRDLVRRSRITFGSLRVLILRDNSRGEGLGSSGKKTGADLKAAALMNDRGIWLNRDKRIIGSIPGIDVGNVYFFRMELCVVGLHGLVQAGIDYAPASRSSSGEPIATSIIVSGGYEDDMMKLEGGNLALERSMTYGIEIRVIRGVKFDQSPTRRVYVYDGLYKVVDFWMDSGKSGFGVYKYKLLRIKGQEEMGSAMLKVAVSLRVNSFSVRNSGFFCNDISMGRESLPVLLYNDLDDDQHPLHCEDLARPIILQLPRTSLMVMEWVGVNAERIPW
ncbi:hypothetical protein KFK09_017685 [Dendrobium nobile]|uniref:YDG domain-containing protein n=1 Tax=Dendrobium nobile TaxID=94219 RepID=A0A8T3ATN6_DENNO|nr:hypothetical protein KFK09_017685 [Dendrobium nobile]